MELLTNVIKDYAWGSTHRLQNLLGLPKDGSPAAELWIGTHPAGCSRLSDGRLLRELVELPYLLKLLAADVPLSLQVHPNRQQARQGFDREEAKRLAPDDPTRNFKDPYHKPELFFAVDTSFLLAGFRPISEAIAVFGRLRGELAAAVVNGLTSDPSDGLKEIYSALLDRRPDGAEELGASLREVSSGPGTYNPDPAKPLDTYSIAYDLMRRYPSDQGWLVSLLLNPVRLTPGQSIYVPAGMPHAHLRGFGVELMAASDNVLRAGMTAKHMDPDLVRECTDYYPAAPALTRRTRLAPGVHLLRPPADEFALLYLRLNARDDERTMNLHGHRLVLTIHGEILVRTQNDEVAMKGGQAVYLSESESLSVRGQGQGVVAATPCACWSSHPTSLVALNPDPPTWFREGC